MINDNASKPLPNDRLPMSMPQSELTIREPISRPIAAPSPVTAVYEPAPKAPTAVMSYNLGKFNLNVIAVFFVTCKMVGVEHKLYIKALKQTVTFHCAC